MRDFLVYADIDGVLTPCQKLFWCRSPDITEYEDERWYKTFSDRDSYVMRLMKDDLVFISNDRRNEYYTNYKGHKFCFIDHANGDKFDGLKRDWAERVSNGEVSGDPEVPRYFYIGDTPFDWLCLRRAIHGFVPSDCSVILYHKWKSDTAGQHITRLDTKGGEGCLEEMVYSMMRRNSLKSISGVTDLPVIKAMREFINGDV